MISVPGDLTGFFADLDWPKIATGVMTAVIISFLTWWKGGFRYLFYKSRVTKALKQYRRELKKDVSSLTVIGRREGFDLTNVYVDMDTVKSDLAGKRSKEEGNEKYEVPRTMVLVGGPGAGKSTYVKKQLLDVLASPPTIPFYIRLREYGGEKIDALLASRLEASGVPNPADNVRIALSGPGCVCVLDGLDEVRPNLQETAYTAINEFYRSYFGPGVSHFGRLIVTCRKEAYRSIPLSIPSIWEVVPLNDAQIQKFADTWPLGFPAGKSADSFWRDLSASSRILEVSRSPLLLVGSLLLYTESTLGIPGERVKYLRKIKDTLVEDWATAQAHVPDPWNNAYSPLLANIAFSMHEDQTTELSKPKCVELIAGVLPSYGYESDQASAFLDSLFKKTGILVSDLPGTVIFVQFMLQEYFSSLNLLSRYNIEKIGKLARQGSWWRESILLAIAQAPDPSAYIGELFASAPIIGAMAVAEAPTPSIHLQETAVTLMLGQLDAGDSASELPIVSLLRKVAGRIERELCDELSRRLEGGDEKVAAIAGRVLATSGTPAATETLSKYPSAWKQCLDTSSYLSSTFEKLLFGWVETPSHLYWRDAVELLIDRSNEQVIGRLINILPKVPIDKADLLAQALLKKMHSEMGEAGFRRHAEAFSNICRCASYVEQKAHLIGELTRSTSFRPVGIAPVALALTSDVAGSTFQQTASKAANTLALARTWSNSRDFYFIFIVSLLIASMFLMPDGNSAGSLALIGLGALATIFAMSAPRQSAPWHEERYLPNRNVPALLFMALILFTGLAFGLTITASRSLAATTKELQTPLLLMLALCIILLGLLAHSRIWIIGITDSFDSDETLLSWYTINSMKAVRYGAIAWAIILAAEMVTALTPSYIVNVEYLSFGALAIAVVVAVHAGTGYRAYVRARMAANSLHGQAHHIERTP